MGKQLLLFDNPSDVIYHMPYDLMCNIIYYYINAIKDNVIFNEGLSNSYICYKTHIIQSNVSDLIEDLIKHKIDVSIRDNFYVIHIEKITFYIEK